MPAREQINQFGNVEGFWGRVTDQKAPPNDERKDGGDDRRCPAPALRELRIGLFMAMTLATIERDVLQAGHFVRLQKKIAEDRRVLL